MQHVGFHGHVVMFGRHKGISKPAGIHSAAFGFPPLQVVVRTALFEDRGAALLWAARQLPALTALDFYSLQGDDRTAEPLSEDYGLPRCQELAELRSSSLTRLRVCMLDGLAQGNMLRLTGLPELQSCEIFGETVRSLDMRIEDTSFRAVPQLQALHLQDISGVQLQPGSLAELTALTALRLINCGLHGVPADVRKLSGTLSVFDVSGNVDLQLDGAAVASVLACSRLRTFGCYKLRTCFYEPHTLMHLVRLPTAFMKRHGRELDVFVDRKSHIECTVENNTWKLLPGVL